jgi:predicted nucleic acid-binding protein
MSRPVVVDASVAAKWFLVEHDSARAFDLLSRGALYAPQLISVEVSAAITRRVRIGQLEQDDARRLLTRVRSTIQRPVCCLVDDADLLERAGEIALLLSHPFQDCLYIACAEQVDAEVITVDPVLLKRASQAFPWVRALE